MSLSSHSVSRESVRRSAALARHCPSHAQACEVAFFATAPIPSTASDLPPLNPTDASARTYELRIAQPRRAGFAADVDASASLSACAHSSQHTSTVFPPIVTLMALASSSQSQAAQVLADMGSISFNTRHPGGDRRSIFGTVAAVRIFSDLSAPTTRAQRQRRWTERWNSAGVRPYAWRKAVLKWLWLENPRSIPKVVRSSYSPSKSSARASRRRSW